MNESERTLRTLFGEAAEITDPAERAAFIDRACAGDPALRVRLESLLRANSAAGSFLGPAADSEALPPTGDDLEERVGRYRLLRKLGEGGCGVVYLAEQELPLRRRVALKVIKLGMDSKAVIARFELERQALALMDHPSIAKVLDAGTTGAEGSELSGLRSSVTPGRPYFVMEWIDGPRITDYCDSHQLPTRERLQLFIQVCRAVQHAHQKGIIHRDLKPSNILVASQDGHPVPKVIDFGIAKATSDFQLTDQTLFTTVNQFLGTPAYMSPEQAGLAGMDIDTRSDIYSLGVLLYELLTGRPPFDPQALLRAGFDEMRRIIREADPQRPSTRIGSLVASDLTAVARQQGCEPPRLLHALRGDLDWVVMKCLEKDRNRRYETANGLAADLGRHLQSEPVAARPPSGVYRLGKIIRRNRLLFATAATVAAALLVATGISVRQVVRTNQARSDLRENLYAADMGGAFAALEAGSASQARHLLEQHRPKDHVDVRGFEWRLIHGFSAPEQTLTLKDVQPLAQSAVSPDGRTVALGSDNGSIRLWDLETRQELTHFRASGGGIIYCLDFSPDGRWLASGTHGGANTVHLYDVQRRELSGSLTNHQIEPFNARFSPDGRFLVTSGGHPYYASQKGELFLWDVASRRQLGTFDGFGKTSVGWVDFSPDGRQLLSGHGDGVIRLWDVASQSNVTTFQGHERLVIKVRFSPDGRQFASSGVDGKLRLWDVESGCSEVLAMVKGAQFYGLAFSLDGQRLLAGGVGDTLRVFDVRAKREISMLVGQSDRVFDVRAHPDGKRWISAGYDSEAKIWTHTGETRDKVQWEMLPSSSSIAFTGDGRWIVLILREYRHKISFRNPVTRSEK